MKVFWAAFSLIIVVFAIGSINAEVYYPEDDKSCSSDGINWSDGNICFDFFDKPSQNQFPSGWAIFVGQDLPMWNDEIRPIFKFEHNIPIGSMIENATFCAYSYWGHCNQVAPRYLCDVGDVYASHIYVPGEIDVPDYNSTVLGTERLWLPDLNGAPIGSGRYWCLNATGWVADDVENGRTTTSIRLHITNHHAIMDNWASQLRIYSGLNNFSRPYLEVQYSHEVPSPAGRSVIITNSDWMNVISAAGVRVPVLVSETGTVTPEIGRFLDEYGPDYIYTIGFGSGLSNSFEIGTGDVPRMFFPNATKAVYASSREKGIFASLIGSYLELPVVFEKTGYSEFLDLENMSIQGIQGFYLSKVGEKGGNLGYIVLTDLDSDEGLLAGRLAGFRNGYIVPAGEDKSFEGIRQRISEAVDALGFQRLFYQHVEYKAGKPLYLGILGGNGSIPHVEFFDPGMEILDDRDGWWLYSDLRYADSNGDGFLDLAEGRMEGLEAASIHMARQSIPKNQSAVLIGEYRHPKFFDMKFFGGGMTQAFLAELALDSANVPTKRIVEQRFGYEIDNMTKEQAGAILAEMFAVLTIKNALEGPLGMVWGGLDISDTIMYVVLEFDWVKWLPNPFSSPEHLEVVDEQNVREIDSGILGYFGVGENGWIIPDKNRLYFELLLAPYVRSIVIENLTFSGFLYNDHDMSAGSDITENVIRDGGSVLASSGIVHDPYTMGTSTTFFTRLAYGESLGEAFLDSTNINMIESALGSAYLTLLWAPTGDLWRAFTSSSVYVKDKFERILFSDPAVRPVEDGVVPYRITYHAGPADSFKAQALIESNYTIGNGTIDVWNADDYLMEREKPVTPLFVREFVLPEGAVVNWVNVSGSYSLEEAEPVLVYNDSHYTNWTQVALDCIDSLGFGNLSELNDSQEGLALECMENYVRPNVSYPYPNSTFWWSSHSLLDNRTLVYVFVPAVLYENGSWAKVLENATVEADYEAQVEMNVLAQDVLLGQNETVKVELMNLGGEASGTVWVFVDGNTIMEFSENVMIPENSSLIKEFSFAPGIGEYEVVAVFEAENGSIGPRYAYFSVNDPAAVPEVNGSGLFVIKPGRYSESSFSLGNSGTAPLEAEISCEGFAGISCEIAPQGLNVMPGEEESFSINLSVPGGYPAGEYSGKIIITGNEIAEPRTVEIALNVSVPEAAYWSLSPLEWTCILPECSTNFSVTNSPDSNSPLHANIVVEGLDMVSTESVVSVGPGEEWNVAALAKIPEEGIPSGTYSGNISFEAGAGAEPSWQKISVTVVAGGPEFMLKKEFSPKKVLLFWKQFVVPKINHVEIYLNNTDDVPIEKINISDEIPDGWKGKKPVLSFVKRNKLALVKEFNYSYGNGYANFLFDFSGKPLQKGEGLQIHYLIYSQPEFIPSGDILTNVSAEARSHDNIYSKEESSAILDVEYFNPPAWLRWLFMLIYGLR